MATNNPIIDWFMGAKPNKNKRDGLVKETNPTYSTQIPSFVSSSFDKQEVTVDEVLSIPAAQAAIDIISSSIAQLPVELIRDSKDNHNGFEDIPDDYRLGFLNGKVNHTLNSYSFKKKIVRDMLLFGASKSYVKFKSDNKTIEGIYPLDMTQLNTVVKTDDGYSFYGIDYLNSTAGERVFYDELLLSVLRDSDDGITGRSIKDGNATVFQTALNQNEYERALMENGAIPTSSLSTDKKLDDNQISRVAAAIKKIYSGGKNAGKTIILENGLRYDRISLDPSTLKFDDNKKAILSDIARVFNIPESMINSSANKYNSLEQNNLWFLQFTLMPLIVNIESAFNATLLSSDEKEQGYEFKFDVNKLIRATSKENTEDAINKFNNGLISNFDAMKAIGQHIEDDAQEFKILSTGKVVLDEKNNTMTNTNTGITVDFDTKNGVEPTISNSERGAFNNGQFGNQSATDSIEQ